jgi:hypothetical protein
VGDPIRLQQNPAWTDREKRPASKYAPVIVSKDPKPSEGAINSMRVVLATRIKTCRALGITRRPPGDCGWFSFVRGGPSHEPHLRPSNVPVIVISGGSAKKIAADLGKDYSLAWHPMNVRNQPIYLLVHRLDYQSYASALGDVIGRFRNMHLIGWEGGAMTGFGAARAAALAFADSLPYRPQRILMMDQDVIQTEGTRHTRPEVQRQVQSAHTVTGKPVIGYGVGYPTRAVVPKPFSRIDAPETADLNSPAQQFVSIQAPFRKKQDDGLYPAYMVAGGEDMLVGMQLKLNQGGQNVALLREKILKKELKGDADTPNAYWSQARVETLKALFDVEQHTVVEFEKEKPMSLWDLMGLFMKKGWIDLHPSAESYNVSACIIERIILRLYNEGGFPVEESSTVFNRLPEALDL